MTWLLAHEPVARGELWSTWARDPVALLVIGMAAVAYVNGMLGMRGRPALHAVVRRRTRFAAAAAVVLLVALASPLDAAATSLFSVHMVQHLLLSAVAAPLLVLAAPVATIRAGLPAGPGRWVQRVGSGVARRAPRQWWTLPATIIGVGTLSVWHVPVLYGAALESDIVHGLEHATILATAVVFWGAVLGAVRRRQVLWSLAGLAAASVHGGALGALLALSSRPWYDAHARAATSWGVDPLADQQVAGAIMWVPTAAVHLGAAALILWGWLHVERGMVPVPPAPQPPRPVGQAAEGASASW